MASSMITSEKKWSSSRRGGMTVLGKVAVPKPINLPSQRLENHGLDPNVEIVPKGTLGWGSRPSSAGSNAWGSSALSPRTDGSGGRPSSGGGNRPSTAGSESVSDSANNAWGPNSRPSSASGALMSNNSSLASLRPRSAETRPGSSQLSRFAEPLADSSGAWSGVATVERLGGITPAGDGFALSSGDFPTLGSERSPGKNLESTDHNSHDRPGLSSGGVQSIRERTDAPRMDDNSMNINAKSSPGSSWKKDGAQYIEAGPQAGMERWHGDSHGYPNSKVAPHPYESWRGVSPVNPSSGGWYRGPPTAPYGAPVGAGGFPREPFPFYHPQVPGPGHPNPQSVPPSGSGPHGQRPKNGDLYRPHLPEPYMHPGMPFRPGFYPGPVPYEGCYGPPMGFCNPNERDFPFMGMSAGPPVSNMYPNQNTSDPSKSYARSEEGRSLEYVESVPSNDPRRHFRAPPGENNSWEHSDEEDKWGHSHHKGDLRKTLPVDDRHIECQIMSEETNSNYLPVGDGVATDKFPVTENMASQRDHALIQKIEGLNAKVRASDERSPGNQAQFAGALSVHRINETSSVTFHTHHPTGVRIPVSSDISSLVDRNVAASVANVTNNSRQAVRMQRGSYHQSGPGLDSGDADGWQKRSVLSAPSSFVSPEAATSSRVKDIHAVEQSVVLPNSDEGKNVSVVTMFEPSDSQRAKMREVAKQRAIQRQKEEEERTREQKAKALAKLEELNRRSCNQDKGSASQKLGTIPTDSAIIHKQKEGENQPRLCSDSASIGGMSSVLAGGQNTDQSRGECSNEGSDVTVSSSSSGLENKMKAPQVSSGSSHDPLPKAKDDVSADDATDQRNLPEVHEVSKEKKLNMKQKRNVQPVENSDAGSTPKITANLLKCNDEVTQVTPEVVVVDEVVSACEPNVPVKSANDHHAHTRKRSKRNGKSKHKLEESSSGVSPSSVVIDPDLAKTATEGSMSMLNPSPLPLSQDSKDPVHISENHSTQAREDNRGNNFGKAPHSRKMPKASQGRSVEKNLGNIWAVKSQNKFEAAADIRQKAAEPALPLAKTEQLVQSSGRSKRAEIERYVPKPAAKEQAQQGSSQPAQSYSVDHPSSDGAGGKDTVSPQRDASAARTGPVADSKIMDSRTKHQKGSWRQREQSSRVLQDDSYSTTNHGKNAHTSIAAEVPWKPDDLLRKGQVPVNDKPSRPRFDQQSGKAQSHKVEKGNATDGWGTMDDLSTSESAFVGVKDQGTSGKGRRHHYRSHKGSGSSQSSDPKYTNSSEIDSSSVPVDANQTIQATLKENRGGGDGPSSHWQPKSQAYVSHDHRQNKSRAGSDVPRDDGKGKKESFNNFGLQRNHDSRVTKDRQGTGQSTSEKVVSSGHQENKRERKTGHVKGPNQESVGSETASFEAADWHNGQRHASGFHWNGNYDGRFSRGHESQGDRVLVMQDKQRHEPFERQGHNLQYEYHPAGSYNNRKPNYTEGRGDNAFPGQKFRERGQGQGHSRRGRGNFYGRNRGNSQVDAAYE